MADAVQRTVFVTATICMPAMTSPEPFGLARLPAPSDYCGLTAKAPRRPQLRVVDTGKDSQTLRLGLRQMMDCLRADGEDSMELIHAEKFIKQHRALQEAIAGNMVEEGDIGAVICHNSGQASTHGGRSSARSAVEAAGSVLAREEAPDENRWAISVMLTANVSFQFRAFLKEDPGGSDGGLRPDQWRVSPAHPARLDFERRLPIRSILTLLHKFRAVLRRHASPKMFLVYVITGQSGGRAVTFRDESGEMFVKHMFLHIDPQTTSGEYMLQAANRISARGLPPQTEVFLWTSQNIWDALMLNDKLVHEVWSKLEENLDTSPKEPFTCTALESARKLFDAGLPMRPTRGGVNQGKCVEPGGLDMDVGTAPQNRQEKGAGGIRVTEDVTALAKSVETVDEKTLGEIAARYYEDDRTTRLLDKVHVFPERELPEEVRKELPTSGPLASKCSNDFKQSLRSLLWDVPAENPRSKVRFDRAGKCPLRVQMKEAETGCGNDYYEVMWIWDYEAGVNLSGVLAHVFVDSSQCSYAR